MRFVMGTVMSSKSVRRDLSGSPILVNLFLFRIIKNLSLESRDFYGILKMHNFFIGNNHHSAKNPAIFV